MDIEKLPRLPPVETGFRIDPALPVIPLAMEVSNAGCAAAHAHPRGQLIYADKGVMRVICRRDIWVVPPSQAVWVPPGIEHEVYFPGTSPCATCSSIPRPPPACRKDAPSSRCRPCCAN